MLRKLLACVMAGIIVLSAFTVTAYFAADSVLVVNPTDRKSSSGQLGMVEYEVVDIPSDLLNSSSSGTSSSSSGSSSSSSASQTPSSVVTPPPVVPSNSSTVTIPPSISSKPPSSSSGSSEGTPTEETLIVKMSSEPEVGVYVESDMLRQIVVQEIHYCMA